MSSVWWQGSLQTCGTCWEAPLQPLAPLHSAATTAPRFNQQVMTLSHTPGETGAIGKNGEKSQICSELGKQQR